LCSWRIISFEVNLRHDPNRGCPVANEPEHLNVDSEADLPRIAAIPAIFVDSWFINTWPGYLRLTFAETIAGASYYRAAFAMELSDAETLAGHLMEMVERKRQEEKDSIEPQEEN
jgi:hypothetical protein